MDSHVPCLNCRERDRRDYPREDGGDQIRVKEEPPDGKSRFTLCFPVLGANDILTEYEYPPHEYDEEYNNYDPNNVKYEEESHFQTEEY